MWVPPSVFLIEKTWLEASNIALVQWKTPELESWRSSRLPSPRMAGGGWDFTEGAEAVTESIMSSASSSLDV